MRRRERLPRLDPDPQSLFAARARCSVRRVAQLERLPRRKLEHRHVADALRAADGLDAPIRLDVEPLQRISRSVGRSLRGGEIDLARTIDVGPGDSVARVELDAIGADPAPEGLLETEGLVVSDSAVDEERERRERLAARRRSGQLAAHGEEERRSCEERAMSVLHSGSSIHK